MPFDAETAKDVAETWADAIASFGQSVTWKGRAYPALVAELPRRDMADLPQGVGVNAANADIRLVSFAPGAFASGLPAEDDTLTWDEGRGPTAYTVLRAPVASLGGAPISVDLTVYRTPDTDSSPAEVTSDTAQDAQWPAPPT